MGYELFAFAIVVALMAIYVYNNERRMGEMIYKLDQTAQLQQVLHFVDTKFSEIEKKTRTKLEEAENRHKLTTDHLQKHIDDITKLSPSIVTFLARLVSPAYGAIAAKATVKFEAIKENIGNGYNSGTGIFTAPTKGLYHFTASARQSRSGYLHLGMFRNGEEMAVSVALNYNSLTIGTTFTLQSGDRVYVKNIWSRASGIVGGGQTYFSGSLLHKM
ncbi:complement C1q-like protein 2 isoform X1 [Mytilus trossulus]|uniref:complement C1q-like protein 2 isoform X1 n=1 Tax=Mytilus trossulus TaxID=6551 RepID=UPI003004BB39